MKLFLRATILGFLLLAAAGTSSANGITLTLNNGGNDTMGGVDVGPYNFTETVNGQNVSLRLVCDDFQDEVFSGEHWTVNLSDYPTLTNVQFSGTTQYEEVAWLVEEIFAHLGSAQTVGDIQWAIWDVFDPGISSHDPYGTISSQNQTNINNWLAMAVANAGSDPYSNLTIYTPVTGSQVPLDDGPPQEYVGWSPVTAPEPGTLVLLASGLLGLVFLRRLAN